MRSKYIQISLFKVLEKENYLRHSPFDHTSEVIACAFDRDFKINYCKKAGESTKPKRNFRKITKY